MEAQSSGTEVRRLHIVYFLSRKGRIEHPHLIRLHHFSRNGVRLRDIKRWLAELRGKDMPQSFSWSYKRRYKTGYVWQDLVDDDLITPISDNEYVLKGSEISSIKEEKAEHKQDHKMLGKEESQSHSSETSAYVSTKSSCEIEEESPTSGSESSTLTDDSIKADSYKVSSARKAKMESNKDKRRSKKVTISEQISSNDSSSKKSSSEAKSKSSSNGASNVFRNLITCGAVETNDSAVVALNKQSINNNNNNKPFLNMCSDDLGNAHSAEIICKRDRLGGSQRVFGTPNWTQQKQSSRKSFDGVNSAKSKSESRDQTVHYKAVNWPNCSQCGKPFKPEKLHAHMKSCKGMKALSKEAAAISAEKGSSRRSVDLKTRESVSGHLLTQ